MPRIRSSSSAEEIGTNEVIVSEILVRFPPKPVLTFKCVSKQWFSLISNHHFMTTHTAWRGRGIPSPSGLLLNKYYLPTPEFEYIPLKQLSSNGPPHLSYLGARNIKILQSCNGLLLCSASLGTCPTSVFGYNTNPCCMAHPSVEFYMEHYRFYVCNPTTKQFKAIIFPFQFLHADSNRIYGVNLAFDPTHSPHFKVVCVLGKSSLDSYFLHVYDSKTDTWNPSPIPIDPPETIFFPAPVFCRRAIHWYSDEETSLYFDVDKECINPMPMPEESEKNVKTIRYFEESRRHLHVIMFAKSAVEFDVLEMEEDYSAWSVRYHVNLHSIRAAFSDVAASCNHRFRASVLSVVRAEREEDSELVLNVFGMVVSYNFKDGTFKFVRYLVSCQEVAARGLRYTWRNAFPFIETLCPVDRACN